MLERVNSNPTFIKRIVTGNETWVYEFDMQTSQQASEWGLSTEPKSIKPHQSRSKIKVMFTVFFDYRGVVHLEFLHILANSSKKGKFVERKFMDFSPR